MPRLVLIIDDSASCAETLQIALETMPNLESRVLTSPRGALAVMRESAGNLVAVVTDLHMPQKDGLEFIREVRAEDGLKHVPILLISGDSDPLLERKALAQGASAFFSKPYSPAAVRRKLEQLLC